MVPSLNPIAIQGFNAGAAVYRTARPDYSPAAIRSLIDSIKVLEIGSGTGIFTKHLAAEFNKVVCVEPSVSMRREFVSTLSNPDTSAKFLARLADDSLSVNDGTAYATGLPSGSVDAVVCAQAFHWFADSAALSEFRRVLRVGGTLGLIWNLEDDRTQWVKEVRGLYEQYEQGTPQYRLGLWKRVFQEPQTAEQFEMPLTERQFEHVHVSEGGLEAVWRRIYSKSYISVMDEEGREQLRTRVLETLKTRGDEVRTDANGNVLYPYVTNVFTTRAV
ncbi:hypothetical protein HDU83_006145 [Entophlyctis luteolus]|nr:hypothetical protein HDU82_005527 [Entophlyctis luteolus]KAJ3353940.1 hypothetical protein HDU83_006145 [Entophlyctis luteolus]